MLEQYEWEAKALARRAAKAMQEQVHLSGALQNQYGQRSSTWLLSSGFLVAVSGCGSCMLNMPTG